MALFCPSCGGRDVHHSRLRSRFEMLRLFLTGRAPFRCRTCRWRGWRRNDGARAAELRIIHQDLTDAELERLDPE